MVRGNGLQPRKPARQLADRDILGLTSTDEHLGGLMTRPNHGLGRDQANGDPLR
jgi:hypothetical protein